MNDSDSRYLAHLENSVKENLLKAISTMRGYCDDAENSVRENGPSLKSAQGVLHNFSWGIANSNTSVLTALGRIQEIESLKRDLEAN